VPFIGFQGREISSGRDVMRGSYEKGGDGLRAEDGETGVLKVKENIAECVTRSAVAIGDDRLDPLQFRNSRICFVEIERRQYRVRRGTNTEIVLQEQHVGDFTDIGGVALFQIGRVISRTKRKASQLDSVGCFQEGKDRDGAARYFSGT